VSGEQTVGSVIPAQGCAAPAPAQCPGCKHAETLMRVESLLKELIRQIKAAIEESKAK
jgi:hypothetical protein